MAHPPPHRPRPRPPRTPEPVDIRRPFRTRDAAASGVSKRRLYSPEFRRIVRSVHILATVRPQSWHEAEAVILVAGDGAFVSHHTAARLFGAVVPDEEHLHASIEPTRHRSTIPGVIVHRSTHVPQRFRGLPVTSPVDTFLDLSACLGLVDLVAVGDSLVHRGRTTPEALVRAAEEEGRGRRAREAARLVRAGVESPMETRLRLLIVLAGLPEPEVNIKIRDERGDVVRRIDMGYSDQKVGIEYDGKQHATSRHQYAADVRRREELAALGWRLWVAVSDDLFTSPGAALARIVAVMRERGMGVPHLRDAWRAHFRGRE
ncbi:hypothetical protein H5397_05945 [Propioniciclava sp. MC1683]|nr:hypothetical protein [Propioniciclava sp. MC1683]NLD86066.1 hypothetical protein [Actinomycetales bacterium]